MKRIIISLATLVISCSAMAKDTMPAEFHGVFESEKKNCGGNVMFPYSDSGFEVTADGISGFEEGCTLKKILTKTDLSLTGKFSCGGPEGEETMKVTLTLSPDKKTVTTSGYFDGAKLRCK